MASAARPARRLREPLLDGHVRLARTHTPAYVFPGDRRVLEDWIGFFELENVLY